MLQWDFVYTIMSVLRRDGSFRNILAKSRKFSSSTGMFSNFLVIVIDKCSHGNGTERIFYEDPNVLYISIHRYDDGTFCNLYEGPANADPFTGSPYNVGAGAGVGRNVNITWDKHRDRPSLPMLSMTNFRRPN